MKFIFSNSIGFFLLAIYLILMGTSLLFSPFPIPAIILGILAVLAGIFILIGK